MNTDAPVTRPIGAAARTRVARGGRRPADRHYVAVVAAELRRLRRHLRHSATPRTPGGPRTPK